MKLLAPAVLLSCLALPAADRAAEARAVEAVLDDWHRAAAEVDEDRYFGHMAPEAVFLGTDMTERWTRDRFRAWAHPIFQRGRAWSFRAVRRAVTLSADGRTAWFDEDLDTPNLGPARGSGVLVKDKAGWLIAQYNLSVPIPNELMKQVKGLIDANRSSAPSKP